MRHFKIEHPPSIKILQRFWLEKKRRHWCCCCSTPLAKLFRLILCSSVVNFQTRPIFKVNFTSKAPSLCALISRNYCNLLFVRLSLSLAATKSFFFCFYFFLKEEFAFWFVIILQLGALLFRIAQMRRRLLNIPTSLFILLFRKLDPIFILRSDF